MAIAPTRFSRVSIGFVDSVNSIAAKDPGDTGAVFSVTGPTAYTGNQTITGTLAVSSTASIGGAVTLDGAVAALSTLTVAGNATFTSGAFFGSAEAANEVVAFSAATAAISLGAIAPLESSSVVTMGLSGATRGDSIFITVDALYPVTAANRDIHWMCSSGSTSGEINIWGVNSTLTSVTPTAGTVVRAIRINHPTYL